MNNKPDRINFGGTYGCNRRRHPVTGLLLSLEGYNSETKKISDFSGGIILLDQEDKVAAKWSFTSILEHWNRKHSQAAYVPSISKTSPSRYRFGNRIQLGVATDFSRFLSAVSSGIIYLDPAIKIENASIGNPKIKRRNQFRIKHSDLTCLYSSFETVQV